MRISDWSSDVCSSDLEAGLQALREAIARYLATFRGLACDWRQVIVTSGAQQAVDLTIQLLLEPGDAVWIEEPGYPGLRGPLIDAGDTPVQVPLAREGSRVDAGRRQATAAAADIVPRPNQLGRDWWRERVG